MMKVQTYLGDGAYVTFDGYGFMLTANHHDEYLATDKVYLEPQCIGRLVAFQQECYNEAAKLEALQEQEHTP